MRNLIMGAAKGYSWDILEPFITSAVKNCPDAEIVLFVDDISEFTRERLISAGVLLGTFPDELKSGVPNNTRWKIFADFLKVYDAAYEQTFITDTRDVIFQGNVFAPFENQQNYLGLTTEADVIGGSNENYSWLVDCFGAVAENLIGKKIICDGTVIGTATEMKIFAETMWQVLSSVERRVNFRIHDQAVANYLIYGEFLPVKNLIEIDVDGEIFTMGLTANFSISGDKILRGEKFPAVVHQYNRHNDAINFVDIIYHDRNFSIDYRFGDMRSAIEQATCLLFAEKIGDAAKLFMKKFLATEDFSDCVKALLRFWGVVMRNPLSSASELMELSAQSALKSVKKFSAADWDEICILLNRARESRHPIDPELKNYVVARLLKLADEKFFSGEREQYLSCVELIISIEGGRVEWLRN